MSAKKDLMEFSSNYWGDPFWGGGAREHPWSTSIEDRRDSGTVRQEASLAANVPFAARQVWSDRGIPELSSPLAD